MANLQDVQYVSLQANQNLPPKAGVSPANLGTPLICWYEADAQPVTVDGTVLSTLVDIGPNKFNLSPPVLYGAQSVGPKWKANLLNGLPGIRFEQRFFDTTGAATSTTWTPAFGGGNYTPWATNLWAGAIIKVLQGTGAGQVRTVSSNTSNTVTVSAAWTTTPDTTSLCVLGGPTTALQILTNGNGSGTFPSPYNAWNPPWTEVSVVTYNGYGTGPTGPSVAPIYTGHIGGSFGGYTGFNGTNTAIQIYHGGPALFSSVTPPFGSPFLLYVEWRGSAANSRIRLTGVEASGPGPTSAQLSGVTLGSDQNGFYPATCDIFAHCVFAGALSAADQAAVEHFFSAKYGFGGL